MFIALILLKDILGRFTALLFAFDAKAKTHISNYAGLKYIMADCNF